LEIKFLSEKLAQVVVGKFNIDKIKNGLLKSDETAFRDLFDQYYPRLLNYAFVIIKNHESAEDIVLEVLQHIWEKRATLNKVYNLPSYLYICVKNKTIDFHKKNSRLINTGFDKPHYEEYITSCNPENQLIDKELSDTINQAIMNLPEKARLVYRLVKEEGMKYREVAEILEISEKTVNNHVIRAMKAIRLEVTEYLKEDTSKATFKIFRNAILSGFIFSLFF
jgi:RNA polymerase sigma-70 factor (ECF subfamily)